MGRKSALGSGPGRGHQPVVHTGLQPESRGDRVQRSADVSETPARGTLQASPRSHTRLLGPQRHVTCYLCGSFGKGRAGGGWLPPIPSP